MKSLLSSLLITLILIGHAQSDKDLADLTVRMSEAKANISFIASDELKGRDTPSEGQRIAAKYISTLLESYGVSPFPSLSGYHQTVSFNTIKVPDFAAIAVDDKTFGYGADFLRMSGGNIDVNAELVFLKHGFKDEIQTRDVTGKVIVTNCGDGIEQNPRAWRNMSAEKSQAAKEAGAVAIIELYNSPQIPWALLVRYLNRDRVGLQKGDGNNIPHFWLSNSNNERSEIFSKANSLEIKVNGPNKEEFSAPNVVGFVEGSDPKLKKEYVVYSAHYDHVGIGRPDAKGDSIYNGTRDNAIGTVAVLMAAKNIAKYPTKRSALFVFFTGEEKGLLGSEWFVDNSPVDLSDIIYCHNVDGAGYNDVTKITAFGLDRTSARNKFLEASGAFGLETISDISPQENFYDRSDQVNFAKKGIPSVQFSVGITEMDDVVRKTYHQPSDEVESLDMDYLLNYWKTYVLAGRLIANDKKKPEWIKGDKYYEAGEKLYDKK